MTTIWPHNIGQKPLDDAYITPLSEVDITTWSEKKNAIVVCIYY